MSDPMRNVRTFAKELKRRKVYHVAVLYAVVGWPVAGGADYLLDLVGAPDMVSQVVAILVVLGFPLALVLGWAYELAPDGVSRTPPTPSRRAQEEGELIPPSDERSIVVLPFVNVSPDPENEYFADGLTEEIIVDLSGIDGIRVISRTSAMRFKRTEKDVRTIGKEVGVRYVLEGSVRKVEDRLRITAQLIDARDDVHLWSERYNGKLDDVFQIQEQVSGAIAQALRGELSAVEARQLARRPVTDARAYESYLRARGEYARGTEDSLNRAIQHLKSAISVVGDNSLLYAALGQTYFLYGSHVVGVHHEYLERAEECAHKVLELEPDSPRARGLLGMILYDRFETEEGLRHMKRAAALDPDDVDNLKWVVLTFSMCAKDEEAAEWLRRLLKIDPLNSFTHWVAGEHHFFAGRLEEARTHFRRAYELDPEGPNIRTSYAQILASCHQCDRALEILDLPEDSVSRHVVWDMIGQAMRYALDNDGEKARRFLTEELRNDARTDMLFSWLLAECYALLGESEIAVEWLKNAVEGGFLNHRFFSEFDPFLEPIRERPQFGQLMTHLQSRWASLRV